MTRRLLIFCCFIFLIWPSPVFAQNSTQAAPTVPAKAAEALRTALFQSQLALVSDPTAAQAQVQTALDLYAAAWAQPLMQ